MATQDLKWKWPEQHLTTTFDASHKHKANLIAMCTSQKWIVFTSLQLHLKK